MDSRDRQLYDGIMQRAKAYREEHGLPDDQQIDIPLSDDELAMARRLAEDDASWRCIASSNRSGISPELLDFFE